MTRTGLLGCRRRNDRGLTTVSWLLITAAVASLAALATVIVAAQVTGTSGRISSSEARAAAAIHAASVVAADARAATAADFSRWADWASHFSRECSLIAVLYAGVEVMHNNFNRATGGTAFDPAAAAAADEQPATATKAQAQCVVG